MVEVSILPGRERRRKWTTSEKLSIVEESFRAGARVADVARRRGLHPNQLHAWRRQARTGELARSADGCRFLSVAVTSDETTTAAAAASRESDAGSIEIVLRNGRILRVSQHVGLTDTVRLADALDSGPR